MKLRTEQEALLRNHARAAFESKALAHLRQHLADRVKGATDAQLIERIRACEKRAASYGLVSPRQVVCFLDASFLLGEYFDTNPTFAWAKKTLASTQLSPSDRASLLLATACSFAKERAGKPQW